MVALIQKNGIEVELGENLTGVDNE